MLKNILLSFTILLNVIYLNAQVNWTPSNNGIPLSFSTNSFTVQNNTVFALGSFYNGFSFIAKLYKSTDYGINWTEVTTTGLNNVYYGKAITSLNGNLYIAGGISTSAQEYSLFKSQDNGQTWSVANKGLPLSLAINSFTSQNNIIYAYGSFYNGSSFISNLYKSSDFAANWTEVVTTGLNNVYYGKAITSLNGNLYIASGISTSAQEYSLFKSQDNGQTWSVANRGLPLSLAINSFTSQNNIIYVLGSFYNGSSFISKLYKSSDFAANWSEITTTGLESLFYGNTILSYNNIFLAAGGISSTNQDYSVFSSFNVVSNVDLIENNIILEYYPNPVRDLLFLKSSYAIKSVSLYSILGVKIYNKQFSENEIKIETNDLPPGTYIVKVNIENSIKSFRIIKN